MATDRAAKEIVLQRAVVLTQVAQVIGQLKSIPGAYCSGFILHKAAIREQIVGNHTKTPSGIRQIYFRPAAFCT